LQGNPIHEAILDLYAAVLALDIHHIRVGVRLLRLFLDTQFFAILFPLLVPGRGLHAGVRCCLPFHSHQLIHSRKRLNACGTIHDENNSHNKKPILTKSYEEQQENISEVG
jgi:hypothetical protein